MKTLHLFFLLLMGLLSNSLAAQDAELVAAIAQLNDYFESAENLQLHTEYRLYKTWYDQSPESAHQGEYHRSAGQFYCQVGDNESLQTSAGRVEIDHKNRMVYFLGELKEAPDPLKQVDLKAVLQLVSREEKSEVQGQHRNFRLYFAEGTEMARIDLRVNVSSGALQQLIVFYGHPQRFGNASYDDPGTKPRLEIDYRLSTAPKVDANQKVNEVLRFDANAPELQPAFDNYQLIRMG